MKKTPLIVIACYIRILAAHAQVISPPDSSPYQASKLKVEEVNFVSGYYQQDGNHSAVTGGIGTEKLTDVANTLDFKLSKLSLKKIKHSLSFETGVDTYTSASSDNIDKGPDSSRSYSLSGASRQDTRVYPSLSYNRQNDKTGITLGAGISYSHEFDYQSRGVNLSLTKSSKDNNRTVEVKLLAYFDLWKVIYPLELRPFGNASDHNGKSNELMPRNSFQASFTFSQVINKRIQLALLIDPAYQQGQLTTLYQRVYFSDNSEKVENLPDTRIKIPVAIRFNYFLGDRMIVRTYYRFYQDDWGNIAHTADLEIPVKLNSFFSLSPFYRFSTQTGIDYFAPYKIHAAGEEFFTSDYDLSPFNSHFIGLGMRVAPPKGVFGMHNFAALEMRYGHYIRSTGLVANSISLALKFK
jgi:hypothetical protein